MSNVSDIPRLFSRHWDRCYTRSKLASDPLYEGVHRHLEHSTLPLLDLGCGMGVLALFLRAKGFEAPIRGLDYDERKIDSARIAIRAAEIREVAFDHHDARQGLPAHCGNVSILDILQFFTPDEQSRLLRLAAERVAPGGKLLIRSCIRDSSWRFRMTVWGDLLAKATFWMKAAPSHYPSREDFERLLSPFGSVRIDPLWGNTPFNNYLVVLTKA